MNTDNLILDLPFDEPSGSSVAYDYSRSRKDASVVNATFTAGKVGNCISFDGEGYFTVDNLPLDMSRDFTILGWVRSVEGVKVGVCAWWEGTAQSDGEQLPIVERWYSIGNEWKYIAIVKRSTRLQVYIDTRLVDTMELPSQPTNVCVIQDVYGTQYAIGSLDDVKVYQEALNEEEISSTISTASTLSYSVDGVDFTEYDVRVSNSKGLLDLPKMKEPLRLNYPDYHGEVVDLADKRVEARDITLDCFIRATSKIDFTTKCNNFIAQFTKDGTQRLQVDIHPTKPLLFDVYLRDGVNISKRWSNSLMVGTFTLKLREPDPVKRIVRHQVLGDSSTTLRITMKTDSSLIVNWGDGQKDYTDDYAPDSDGLITMEHTYIRNCIYYAVIGGVIEDISQFSTNGIVVWNKI